MMAVKEPSEGDPILCLGIQSNRKRMTVAIAVGLLFGIVGGISYNQRHGEFGLVESILLMSILTIPSMSLFSLIPLRSDIVIQLFKTHLTIKRRYQEVPELVEFSGIAEVHYERIPDGDYPLMRVHFRKAAKPPLYIVLPFRKQQINELLLHLHTSGLNVYIHEYTS